MTGARRTPGYELQRICINREGYDGDGAYWGAGPDVFIAATPDRADEITVRARTLKEAKEKIAAERAHAPDQKRENNDKLGGNTPRKTRTEIAWTNPVTRQTLTIRITHVRDYLASGSDHLEIESLKPAKTPLPMTETGYRSHFLPALDLMNAGGPITFVTAWLEREAASKAWQEQSARQAQSDLLEWAAARSEVAPRQRSSQRSATTAQRARAMSSKRAKLRRDPA